VKVSALLTEKRSLREQFARRVLETLEKEVVKRDELQAQQADEKGPSAVLPRSRGALFSDLLEQPGQ
jgi:hypothetical protein